MWWSNLVPDYNGASGDGKVSTPTVPAAPSAAKGTIETLRPEDYNPDIAAAKMAQELVRQMGAPAVVSKEFVVRKGIWEGLNHVPPKYDEKKLESIHLEINAFARKMYPDAIHPHRIWMMEHPLEYKQMIKPAMTDPGNPTGYNCSLRLAVYRNVEKNSVNIDGKYFTSIWQYLMKPKYTIIQPGQQPANSFEEQPPLWRRIVNKFTGGGNNNGQPNNQ